MITTTSYLGLDIKLSISAMIGTIFLVPITTEILSLIYIYPVPITTEILSLIYIYPVPITAEILRGVIGTG
jgi:hypothetical protein